MTEMPDALRTRAVAELLDERFIVPKYQRGYRWTKAEVKALLEDIESFRTDPDQGDFYCLQPVVIRRRKDGWCEVVDGQQRLTTLRLIITAMGDKARDYGVNPYPLKYETRDVSERFLEDPSGLQAEADADCPATIRSTR